MRKKELKLVITFHTTADAMAMEKECKKVGAQGRMIPVPRSISAGCGLSWCAPLECREELKNVMQGIGLEEEEIHECLVYEEVKRGNRKMRNHFAVSFFVLFNRKF